MPSIAPPRPAGKGAVPRTQRQQLAAAGLPVLAVEGIVTAVVGVTGVRDHVNDIIVPGAFQRTLRLRRPKVVFHHDWLRFLGRVLHIEELMPGDKRLPKRQKNGLPWPADAGALVATMQFNMATEAGRTGYEWARFYSETGECEWSIGYKVVPGKTAKGKDDTRYIYDLDVFELSLVLFGAASETMTLEVKDAWQQARTAPYWEAMRSSLTPAAQAVMEAKALQVAVEPNPDGIAVGGMAVLAEDTGRVLMLQRWLDPTDPAGGMWEFPGGHLEDGESPFEGAAREWQEETGASLPNGEVRSEWDSPNGIYRGFVYVVPRQAAVDINSEHQNRDEHNPDDPNGRQIEVAAWFDPQTLPDMPSLRPECRDTDWSALFSAVPKPRTPLQTKTAAQTVMEAKTLAPAATPTTLETKSVNADMIGSFEERQHQLTAAARTLFCKDCDCDEGIDCWVSLEATYPDRVIVSHYSGNDRETYEIAYSLSDGQVSLGQPEEVQLQVVAVRGEEEGEVEADADDVNMVRFTEPAIADLSEATALVMLGGLEGKGLAAMRAPVLALIDALAVKGMDVHDLVMGDDADEEEEIPGAPDAAPPAPDAEAEPDTEPDADTDNPDQMQVEAPDEAEPDADEQTPEQEAAEASPEVPDGDEDDEQTGEKCGDMADRKKDDGYDTEGKALDALAGVIELDMAEVQAQIAALRS